MNSEDKQIFVITLEQAGQRLDVFCAVKIPEFSRAVLQKAIKAGEIQIDGKTVKPRASLSAGQTVEVSLSHEKPREAELVPVEIPILFEDKDIVVVNKPAGISVHPGAGARQFTVVDWLTSRYPDITNVGDHAAGEISERPGIVHRLDKETSGVLIIAKTQKAFVHLKEQFKRQYAMKEYLALVFGIPGEPVGRIVRSLIRSPHNPLRRMVVQGKWSLVPAKLRGAKEAITNWRKEETFGGRYALLRVFPATGRMHQIRVHLHYLGFPIVGDALYTFKRQKSPQGVKRHMLHAEKLTIVLFNGEKKTFVAPLPEDFTIVLENLRHGLQTTA